MNEQLKAAHYADIPDERARHVYDLLCSACESREGGMTDADQQQIYDYSYQEMLKNGYRARIVKWASSGGIRDFNKGTKNEYAKADPSVDYLQKSTRIQNDILNSLRLTALKRHAQEVKLSDDFDTFD